MILASIEEEAGAQRQTAPDLSERPVVLSAVDITRSFFGNVVLQDVSLAMRAGSIHALLGENGAGKSTLINILSGGLRPDSGAIIADGESHDRLNPTLALRLGIAVVHQELSLAPHLSVAENIGLGQFPRRAGFIDYARLAREASAILTDLEADFPLAAPAHTLPLGAQQLVEIAKALYRKPRVLILDEPTSSLSAVEVARLKRVMLRLRDQGIALLFISHRLDEVLELCDWVTVLKDGRRTADRSLTGVTPGELVRLMVGRDPGDLFPPFDLGAKGPAVLRVKGLNSARLRGVDLDLHRGEILGLGGLVGQGQEQLLLALFGAHPHRAEIIEVAGVATRLSDVRTATRLGIAYVPSDRKAEGLHLSQSLHFNLVLPTIRALARSGLRRFSGEKARVRALLDQFSVRGGGPHDRAIQLSGGNQQKIAIAKWLPLQPSVLLLNDPTRGVDVETKRELYLLLRQLTREGASVILASSDTPELVELCDRVIVLSEGRVRASLERDEISEEAIVHAAVGAGRTQGAAA
jgi:ribose transport system ATP-binding protein